MVFFWFPTPAGIKVTLADFRSEGVATIAPDDFELEPFVSHGGYGRANDALDGRLPSLLEELNRELVA